MYSLAHSILLIVPGHEKIHDLYKLYLKKLLVPTFRTSGIIPFLPSTKLHRYRTPRFAISCHHKIMSAPPRADTYAKTTARLTASTTVINQR
jgi:hypothetical protein